MAKGEIACFEQFLLCHYVFKKMSAAEASESVYIRERVKGSFSPLLVSTLYLRVMTFETPPMVKLC